MQDGLGDTIRVSLTEAPEEEIDPCTKLANLGMKISAEQKGVVSIDVCHYQQYVYMSTVNLCFLFHIQECGHCLWWLGATALFLPTIGMSFSSYFVHCNLSILLNLTWVTVARLNLKRSTAGTLTSNEGQANFHCRRR